MDLNRNFGYKWGYDDIGSSDNACSETYRGPEPFSEPEARAIRDLILDWPTIRVSYNLHAWGNLGVIPMNWYPKDNSILKRDYPKAAQFYEHILNANLNP